MRSSALRFRGDSLGYVRLSDDGKVMLISGETGGLLALRCQVNVSLFAKRMV